VGFPGRTVGCSRRTMLKEQTLCTIPRHCRIPTIKHLLDRAAVLAAARGGRDKLAVFLACALYLPGWCFPSLLGRAGDRLSSAVIRRTLLQIGSVKMKVSQVALLELGMNYEEQLWRYLLPRPGDVFLDVGANVGWYSLNVGRAVGPAGLVLAVEPDQDNFAVLKENIRLNHLSNVIALNFAAWDRDGELDLILAETCTGHTVKREWASSARPWSWFSERPVTVKVPARRLDDVLQKQNLTRIDWVKIDVEGAEVEVLRGLRQTLTRFQPRILVESESPEDLTGILQPMGYQVLLLGQLAPGAPPNYFCYTR
jgi:FkbM family methyltransferase